MTYCTGILEKSVYCYHSTPNTLLFIVSLINSVEPVGLHVLRRKREKSILFQLQFKWLFFLKG